jgi:4-amino-4-deoxy-L-arabinose transferase-like glycosyltransferase
VLLASSLRPPARSLGLLIVVALAPLWLVGLFGRGLWTPDEPREADIAWRMSHQQDRTLPQLAGTPFLEKPPLSYWMSAGAISLLGDSAAAARAPNLLYALIGALSVGAISLAMQADLMAAVLAAVIAGSALTAYRTAVWLAPDAALLAGCALALLGAFRGYRSSTGRGKLGWYSLMHLGAAIGFMAKSAPGWLVPALALLTLIVWERRWSELRRWQLYAGLLLQVLIIGPWLLAVMHGEGGTEALRTLFWNNVVGRFTRVSAPAALDYTSGHHNSPGKYLFELPLYLLPWTLIVAAALARAWTRVHEPGTAGTSWRFALAASVPFLVLLSLAATARDVYAAPALMGFGLLAGLWAHETEHGGGSARDTVAVQLTAALVILIAWLLAAALLVFAVAGVASAMASVLAAVGVIAAAHTAVYMSARARRTREIRRSLGWLYAGYATALCVAVLVAAPVIDRWQNLPGLAQRIHADTAQYSLALLNPDETTIAMLDHGLYTPFAVLRTAADAQPEAEAWLRSHGSAARLLVLLPGHAPGKLTRWLGFGRGGSGAEDGVAARLIAAGTATLVRRYELPQGRRYALLGAPLDGGKR